MGNGVLSPQVGTLDVFVELFSEIEKETEPGEFYNRLCEALCRLTTMQRAVLMLYDESLARVVAAGSHGIDPSLLVDVHGTLDETPVAQRALARDEVEELSPEQLAREIPARYKGALQVTTLTCTPLSAGKRWFGVIFADRGGGRFKVTDEERHTMWTLGKLAALAASARIATRQQERQQRLYERIELAREVHERVMHRLFGVSLVLSSEVELGPKDRERCRTEMRDALADLRTALERTLVPRPHATSTTLREELNRLERGYGDVPVSITWNGDSEVPGRLEALSQSVLGESLRNAVRHAEPSSIDIGVNVSADTFSLEVVNDGVKKSSGGTGMGLRLASLEAIQIGGVVEFGSAERERWRTRLVVPL
jgi:signal transduction histidine kinase